MVTIRLTAGEAEELGRMAADYIKLKGAKAIMREADNRWERRARQTLARIVGEARQRGAEIREKRKLDYIKRKRNEHSQES